jgi:hypothetical protein
VSSGFSRNAAAPSFLHSACFSGLPNALITMTGTSGRAAFTARSTLSPLRIGILRSVMMRSNLPWFSSNLSIISPTFSRLLQFVPPQHPAASQIRVPAHFDAFDYSQETLFLYRRLEGNDDLGLIIKDYKTEVVLWPKIAHR